MIVATVAEMFALALRNQRAGELRLAQQLCQQVLQIEPTHVDALHLLGNILLRQGKPKEAAVHYDHVLSLEPHDAQTHCNLGIALAAEAKLEDAVTHFHESLRLDPNNPAAQSNLGTALRSLGNWEEAVQCFERAVELDPQYAEPFYNLGNAYKDRGLLDKAVARYRHALQLNPNLPNVHNNLGSVLQRQDKLDEAIDHYRQATRLRPHHVEAHRNLGTALQAQGKFDEALAHFRKALSFQPNFPEAHHDLGLLLLLRGDFEPGWREYAWRWKVPGAGRRPFPGPLWDGSTLENKTILLHAEQGLGDTIQFIRYAAPVKARGGKVILECQLPLIRLLASADGIHQLVGRGSPLPVFDAQAPLLDLPGILRTSQATIPAAVPYLHADDHLVAHWRRELEPLRGFKVGIAWQGNPAYRGDQFRSFPLSSFAALQHLQGLQLISLQKGPGTEQLRTWGSPLPVLDLGSQVDEGRGAFMDSAAIVKNLDLVISSDTAIPHLAGALGIPVWVALPLVPDWRWLLDRQDSPWYPTMRLFRQTRRGRWEDVFAKIAAELQDLLTHRLSRDHSK